MDIQSLINSFATGDGVTNGTCQLQRRQAGALFRGVAGPITSTLMTIQASVQPATGKDLLRLPEGRRANQTRVIFTTTELFVGDQGDPFLADVVMINGEPWEVQHVETWLQAGQLAPGFRCVAQEPT